jgi:hypothetical protein
VSRIVPSLEASLGRWCPVLLWWRPVRSVGAAPGVVPAVLLILFALVRPARVLVLPLFLHSGFLVTGGLTSRLPGHLRLWYDVSFAVAT